MYRRLSTAVFFVGASLRKIRKLVFRDSCLATAGRKLRGAVWPEEEEEQPERTRRRRLSRCDCSNLYRSLLLGIGWARSRAHTREVQIFRATALARRWTKSISSDVRVRCVLTSVMSHTRLRYFLDRQSCKIGCLRSTVLLMFFVDAQ